MQAALQFQSTASVFQLTFTHSLADSFILCWESPLFLSRHPVSISLTRTPPSLSVRMTFTSLSFAKSFFSLARLVLSPCGLPPRAAASGKATEKAVFIFIWLVRVCIVAYGSLRGGDFIGERADIPERFPGGAVSMAAVPAAETAPGASALVA